MKSKENPRIYIADLAAYNAGELHGEWVELDEDSDVETIREVIAAMLSQSPVLPEGIAEEWAIHDHEGFHPLRLGEYATLETVDAVASLRRKHGELAMHVLDHLGGPEELQAAANALEEGYAGSAVSFKAWVEQYLKDAGALETVPERWRPYLDIEAYARDMVLEGALWTIEMGVECHVFWSV